MHACMRVFEGWKEARGSGRARAERRLLGAGRWVRRVRVGTAGTRLHEVSFFLGVTSFDPSSRFKRSVGSLIWVRS